MLATNIHIYLINILFSSKVQRNRYYAHYKLIILRVFLKIISIKHLHFEFSRFFFLFISPHIEILVFLSISSSFYSSLFPSNPRQSPTYATTRESYHQHRSPYPITGISPSSHRLMMYGRLSISDRGSDEKVQAQPQDTFIFFPPLRIFDCIWTQSKEPLILLFHVNFSHR